MYTNILYLKKYKKKTRKKLVKVCIRMHIYVSQCQPF